MFQQLTKCFAFYFNFTCQLCPVCLYLMGECHKWTLTGQKSPVVDLDV